MKYKLLCALLALTNIELHSNFFGNKKPTAKLDEEQLQSIEDALGKNDTSALQSTIDEQNTTISTMQTEKTDMENALSEAFSINGLDLPEGTSVAEAIATLGTKCKEFGGAKNTHSIPPTDGKDKQEAADGLIDGYFDPKDPHNQID